MKQVAGLAVPGIDVGAVSAMSFANGIAESFLRLRNKDQMNVIRHQAPRPRLDGLKLAGFCQQIALQRVSIILEENALAVITPLGDVVRQPGDQDS